MAHVSHVREDFGMRIDSHIHLWEYTLPEFAWIDDPAVKRDFVATDLEQALDSFKFDAAIAVQARQSTKENSFLLQQMASTNRIAGCVGWVDLQSDFDEEETKGLVGVRHIVQGEPDPEFLRRQGFRQGVQRLPKLGLTYDLLIYAHQLPAAIDFCRALPEVRIVLDHCAKPVIRERQWDPWADNIAELARCPNVWCKVSGLSFEADHHTWTADTLKSYIKHAVQCFGPERIMVGSDWPVSLTPGTYTQNMNAIESCLSSLNQKEREQVWGLNAAEFYGIATPGSPLDK